MAYPAVEGLCSPEIEISEGGTMLDGKGKFSDLKAMLDSNKENIKMDAMRRIINMVARGKDVSELFAAVVKNVAAKNLELKKLVYVYLVRYAEEQQDLALLSISTFQRALKDSNQLIRASALRVLSSIRVQMISPVVMLAIREAIRDMSPYVRKVAAHAIPKLFALDHELQSQLIECIDNLLGDKRTLVLGSAVYAFEETCPDRLDLLHRHFRLFCRALADVDEWGQVVMIGLLTRYARTQFTSPFMPRDKIAGKSNEKSETDSSGDESSEEKDGNEEKHQLQSLDPDYNLLIASVRPLLQSRNPAVVMAVAQLFFHIAPHSQLVAVPRALVRLLRGPDEVQYVVLVNIATICASRQTEELFAISKRLFEPFLKSFFVRNSDTIHVKRMKLCVLASLVSEANVQLVVRELQAYLQMVDIAETAIDTIGRCALAVPMAAEVCLGCLIRLISTSGQEQIVCASVVVLKRLLHADAPMALLRKMFHLINTVKAPMARSCILWLIGTHISKVPKLAPDLLRIVAKTFCEEADFVKLQALNLAVRIWAIDPANRDGKCAMLIKYVFQLARYDRSYDIRDRCRFLRHFLFAKDENSIKFPLDIFLRERPAPVVNNSFADRAEHFQLGTLSHLLNQKCTGYTELPNFPSQQPDPTTRRSAYPLPSDAFEVLQGKEMVTNEEEEEEAEGTIDGEGMEEEEDDEDEEEEQSSVEEEDEEVSEHDEDESDDDDQEMGAPSISPTPKEETIAEQQQNVEAQPLMAKSAANNRKEGEHSEDLLLLDIDFGQTSSASQLNSVVSRWSRATAQYVPDRFELQLVEPLSSGGLCIVGRFSRSPSLFSTSMVTVELQISYQSRLIRCSDVQLSPATNCFLLTSGPIVIEALKEGERRTITLGIDFGDSTRTSDWTLNWGEKGEKTAKFEIQAPFEEQVEGIECDAEQFAECRAKLTGMNQVCCALSKRKTDQFIGRALLKICNCKQVLGLKLCFAAQTVARKELVLIALVPRGRESCNAGNDTDKQNSGDDCAVQVNCENITFASLLCQELVRKLDSDF